MSKFNSFLNEFYNYNFIKIFCSGKIFRVKKFKNFIKFLVNTSHDLFFIVATKDMESYKLYKNKFLFKSNTIKIRNMFNKIINYRKLNTYTKRGLKINKNYFLKRKGKSNITI